jgi:hypothetical protein
MERLRDLRAKVVAWRSWDLFLLVDLLHFECSDFAKPPAVALFASECGCEEGIDQIARSLKSNDSAADAKHVHVVVFDALVSRVVVLNEPGANSWNLVRANGRAHSTAANRQTAAHLAVSSLLRERNHEIGIAVAGIQNVGPEIDHLVARLSEINRRLFFQNESTVVGGDSYSHLCFLLGVSFLGSFVLR